jgi:hypothetical protein
MIEPLTAWILSTQRVWIPACPLRARRAEVINRPGTGEVQPIGTVAQMWYVGQAALEVAASLLRLYMPSSTICLPSMQALTAVAGGSR